MALKKEWFNMARKTKEYVWPWKRGFFSSPSSWRWRRLNLHFSLLDDIAFHVLYFLEAVVLVAVLCFFFLCCGLGTLRYHGKSNKNGGSGCGQSSKLGNWIVVCLPRLSEALVFSRRGELDKKAFLEKVQEDLRGWQWPSCLKRGWCGATHVVTLIGLTSDVDIKIARGIRGWPIH